MKFLFVLVYFFFGQGVGFNTKWENPEPGDMKLPDFKTFDYEWREYSFQDVKDFSVIFLFHPLDNTAAKTRERNLRELHAVQDFVKVFSITQEGNWGSNRELGKRIEPRYPILFSQPDVNLETWVKSWKKSLPSALLIQNGAVIAHGEPLAILAIILDIRDGYEVPSFANSGELGFWSRIENLYENPVSNLQKWMNWKHLNSQSASSEEVLTGGLLMLDWGGMLDSRVKRELVWEWLNHAVNTGPPENKNPSEWLGSLLPNLKSTSGLRGDSYGWIHFLNGEFEKAALDFEKFANENDGFMSSVSKTNSLLSKSLDENLENPHEILPDFFWEIFTEARDSTKAPLIEYLSAMVKKQENWWGQQALPEHFYFLQGVVFYYMNEEEKALPYFEKLKDNPAWLKLFQDWEIY